MRYLKQPYVQFVLFSLAWSGLMIYAALTAPLTVHASALADDTVRLLCVLFVVVLFFWACWFVIDDAQQDRAQRSKGKREGLKARAYNVVLADRLRLR